jgi:hypothetical protein
MIKYFNILKIFLNDEFNPLYLKYLVNLYENRVECIYDEEFNIHFKDILSKTELLHQFIKKKNTEEEEELEFLKQLNDSEFFIKIDFKKIILKNNWNYYFKKLNEVQLKNFIILMLMNLDSNHIFEIFIQNESYLKNINRNFFTNICQLALNENDQRKLKNELLKIIDSHLWTQKKIHIKPQLTSFYNFKNQNNEETYNFLKKFFNPSNDISNFNTNTSNYIEDNYINWGLYIETNNNCNICKLPLNQKIGLNLISFKCGHTFHSECCPLQACSECFLLNFKEL